jgi:hypothetical protein
MATPAGASLITVAAMVLVAGVLLLAVTGGPSPARRARRAAPAVTQVRLDAGAAPVAVPRSFLGLSTEYWTIPVWARHPLLLGRVLSLITPNGPMVLRIGGDSADHSFWAPNRELPEWIFELTPSWLTQVREMIGGLGVHVLLDLNLVTATPANAAQWARTAERAWPPRSILGFEIGNEPDIYSRPSWRTATRGGRGSARRLPSRMTAQSYASAYLSYDRALDRAVPNVPMLGPALAEPNTNLSWITRLLAGPHPGLTAITAHRYPLSQCSRPGARTFPTIARVLAENATAGMANSVRPAVALARQHGLPVRLTEINSVTCGGRRGVSDTFATALWAPDALFELMHAGIRSAAVHVRANAINMAFSLTDHGLIAHPLLYGLALFSRTLGTSTQLIPLRLNAAGSAHIKAWAVRDGKALRVLLINKGPKSTRISLAIPATGTATVQRMLAPSARSTSAITLAGQRLGPHGTWEGTPATATVHATGGGYTLTVPRTSAALLTATLRH